jgi:hypothetical protein
MNGRTGVVKDGVPGRSGPMSAAGETPTYFELFRTFNSEEAFFDFARQLKSDSPDRPGTMKRPA